MPKGAADAGGDESAVGHVTWWLMDCDLPNRLNWARLREHVGGAAEVLTCDGEVVRFASADEAREWLSEDEYSLFDESLRTDNPEVRWAEVRVPTAADDAGLVNQMLVGLTPRDAHAELRVYGEPEWSLGFEVVTLHPLADDQATLSRLRLSPLDCLSCDLYWVANESLVFVSIGSWPTWTEPSVSIRRHAEGPVSMSFNIRTECGPITGAVIGGALRWLQAWLDAMAYRSTPIESETWTIIAHEDVIAPTPGRPRYQLVLQRPALDFETLVAYEESVRIALGQDHHVDGHDSGVGESNVFVLTNNPWAAFNQLVVAALITVVPGLKVAFRQRTGVTFEVLWPPEETAFRVR